MKKIGYRYTNNIFENIKHIDEYGNEYWYARELSKVLEYKDWRNFLKVLNKAKEACKNSGFNIDEQLVEVNKLSKRNNNATANIQDYKLSRYICYLKVEIKMDMYQKRKIRAENKKMIIKKVFHQLELTGKWRVMKNHY